MTQHISNRLIGDVFKLDGVFCNFVICQDVYLNKSEVGWGTIYVCCRWDAPHNPSPKKKWFFFQHQCWSYLQQFNKSQHSYTNILGQNWLTAVQQGILQRFSFNHTQKYQWSCQARWWPIWRNLLQDTSGWGKNAFHMPAIAWATTLFQTEDFFSSQTIMETHKKQFC